MGLAASQARLLLLTARKSDLEYRAQQITNSEMILAMQTEQVAREYSIKISNQALFFTDSTDSNQTTKCLTASMIAQLANGGYRLEERDASGNWHNWQTEEYYDKDGNSITAEEYNALSDEDKNACTVKVIKGNDYNGLELLEGIKNGTLRIMNANGEEMLLNSNNGFTQSYYTDDDREAEAEYENKTASIQVKEKRLQNDLNQVETQQKACDTEIDSVKKVMEKNVERTFKVFS